MSNTSFGDSVTLLEALKYIFDKAGTRPAVVNVSLGTNGGPHDGTTLVDQGIDALVTAAANRAVVIAASNSFDDGIHATGTLTAGVSHDLHWDVVSTLFRPIELELWYAGSDRFKVELIGPNGVVLATAGAWRDQAGSDRDQPRRAGGQSVERSQQSRQHDRRLSDGRHAGRSLRRSAHRRDRRRRQVPRLD